MIKVSVVVYFHKDRGWLKDAIDSVYNQQAGDFEIELLRSDLLCPNHANMSASENLNFLINLATGDYIKYLSEDDMLTPNSIKDSVDAMELLGCDFLHGNAYNKIGSNIQKQLPTHRNPSLEMMLDNNVIHGGTLFYKRELLSLKPFDESLSCAEEYDVNLWLLKNGYTLGYVDKFLYIYRRHVDQKSLGKDVDQVARKIKIDAIKKRYR